MGDEDAVFKRSTGDMLVSGDQSGHVRARLAGRDVGQAGYGHVCDDSG